MNVIATFVADPNKLRGVGLTVWVYMEPVPNAGPSAVPPRLVGALLDPGSEVCGIHPSVAERFVDVARIKRKIWRRTLGLREEDALKCKIVFQDQAQTSRTLLFSIVEEVKPYELLIGRDLLSEMKLEADFKTGEWSLSWSGTPESC